MVNTTSVDNEVEIGDEVADGDYVPSCDNVMDAPTARKSKNNTHIESVGELCKAKEAVHHQEIRSRREKPTQPTRHHQVIRQGKLSENLKLAKTKAQLMYDLAIKVAGDAFEKDIEENRTATENV